MPRLILAALFIGVLSSLSAIAKPSADQATLACRYYLSAKFKSPKWSDGWRATESIVADYQVEGSFMSHGKNRAFKCFVEGSYITRVVVWGSGDDWTDSPILSVSKRIRTKFDTK